MGLGTVPPAPTRRRRWVVSLAATVGLTALGAVGWVAVRATRVGGPTARDHRRDVAQARALLAAGRPDLALRLIPKFDDDGPGAAEALAIVAKARLAIDPADVAIPRRALERSLRLDPGQAEPTRILAGIYLGSGDGVGGLALLAKAAELEPDDYRPWFATGRARHHLGDLAGSAAAYAEALRRSPPPAEASESRTGLVRSLLDLGREAEAAAALAEAGPIGPGEPELLALAARAARDAGRVAEATDLLDRSLAADPDGFDALVLRATLALQAGRPASAEADLERAARLQPDDPGPPGLLVQVFTRLGRKDRAAEALARLEQARARTGLRTKVAREIARSPNDPAVRSRLGRLAAEAGMLDLAADCYRGALVLDPAHAPAVEGLAALRAAPIDSGPARPENSKRARIDPG